MNSFAVVIAVVVGIAFLNQVVMRVERLRAMRAVYLSMQTLNLVTGFAICVFGLPGFENNRPATWMMGAIFFFRAYWNHHELATAAWQQRQVELAEERERIRAFLEEGEAPGDDDEA